MLQKINLLFIGAAFFVLTTTNLASIQLNLSTGVNVGAVGNPLFSTGTGTRDDYWFVLSTPAGAATTGTKAWIKSAGLWNSIPGTLPIFANSSGNGRYEYERCFCINDLTGATLDLVMRADNKADLYVNNYYGTVLNSVTNDTFDTAKPAATSQYTSANGLKFGKNCIRVRVNNESGLTGFALLAILSSKSAFDTFDERSVCCSKKEEVFIKPLK